MNKDIRRFLANLIIISTYVVLVVLMMLVSGIFIMGNQYEESYQASLIDKITRIKSINIPKIILVGNSNLAFGMNSKLLEDAMNMPVVNLGLNGGMGNAFHENIAKLNISSGDLIIICHSTYSDDNKVGNVELCWTTLEYHKDLWGLLTTEDYPNMLIMFPKYWRKAFQSLVKHVIIGKDTHKTAYHRNSFNKYGDVVVKPDHEHKTEEQIFWAGREKLPQINNTCIKRLNEFNQYAKERGAVLLVAGYPIAYGKYTNPAEEYMKFQEELSKKLNFDVISDFRDYFIPYEYFYNTDLHLDERGAKIRTLQLIKDIKRWQTNKKLKIPPSKDSKLCAD